MKEVLNLSIEPEVKEVLNDHKKILNEHADRIEELRIDSATMKEKLNGITFQLDRIENNSLTSNNALLASNNSVLQTLNLVVGNTAQVNKDNTEVEKIKTNNKKEVIMKVLGIAVMLICAYYAGKGIHIVG